MEDETKKKKTGRNDKRTKNKHDKEKRNDDEGKDKSK